MFYSACRNFMQLLQVYNESKCTVSFLSQNIENSFKFATRYTTYNVEYCSDYALLGMGVVDLSTSSVSWLDSC